MGSKHRADETNDERMDRKRAKKELKKAKRSRELGDSANIPKIYEINVNIDSVPVTKPQQGDAISSAVATNPDNDDQSRFFQKRVSLVVSLYPAALANVTECVKESIQSMLLKYSDGLGGVLLAFDKVKIIGKEGVIFNELAPIHYTVELDGLVFCPAIGTRLQGVVNESFPSHVGMLVHRFFNAMVPAEQLEEAGYLFDRDLQHWAHDATSKILGYDDCVDFTIDKLHECAGIISIEGSRLTVSQAL